MRGTDSQQAHMFSYVSPERRVPADHPLRPIRAMVDAAFEQLADADSPDKLELLTERRLSDSPRPSAGWPLVLFPPHQTSYCGPFVSVNRAK